jgi:5'-nucleotidase
VAAYAEFSASTRTTSSAPAWPSGGAQAAGFEPGASPEDPRVEVILLSRNSADTGLRIFNSIQHYGLGIIRATFTAGEPTWPYVKPFGTDLFLSANPESVRSALRHGIAAATILPKPPGETAAAAADQIDTGRPAGQLRIAFDGDAVIFGDESERISREQGVEAFGRHERERAREPLSGGPFRGFLSALHTLQEVFPAGESAPIRTALVTARSAPAHERVIRTLREWGVRLDEALFLGGRHKGPSCRRSAPTSSSTIRSTTSTVRASMWPPAMCRTVSPTRVRPCRVGANRWLALGMPGRRHAPPPGGHLPKAAPSKGMTRHGVADIPNCRSTTFQRRPCGSSTTFIGGWSGPRSTSITKRSSASK